MRSEICGIGYSDGGRVGLLILLECGLWVNGVWVVASEYWVMFEGERLDWVIAVDDCGDKSREGNYYIIIVTIIHMFGVVD